MNEIRAFIAIELNPEIQTRLREVVDRFINQGVRCVRWVAVKNIHLTLQFLGEVPPSALTSLKTALQPVAAAQEPFIFSVEGIGAFPNILHPRIVWTGLQAPPNLMTLQFLIGRTIEQLGMQIEDRPFSPHLTLGRVRRDASPNDLQQLSMVLKNITVGNLGSVTAQSATLIRSDLRPDGPIYTPIQRFPLKG